MQGETYWFSAKQRDLLEQLGVPSMFVNFEGDWQQYTVKTEGSSKPTVWPDYIMVAQGSDLLTKKIKAVEPVVTIDANAVCG